MAEQKITEEPHGKKKPGQAKKSGDEKKSSDRNFQHILSRKAKNVARNLAWQRKQEKRANRPNRVEGGKARAMRRASVTMATGATSGLAAVERRLNPAQQEPTLEQQIAGIIREMFGEPAGSPYGKIISPAGQDLAAEYARTRP